MSSDDLKKKGNEAFSAGRFKEAIELFTSAIQLDPNNHVLYSNRSAAEASLSLWESAFEDAELAIAMKPDWSKGYGRKGAALVGLGEHEKAIEAYKAGLQLEPENAQLKQGLAVAEANFAKQKQSGTAPSSNPFSDPQLVAKLTSNPQTAPFFAQPDFVQKLAEIQKDPQSLSKHISDPRIMGALGAMLGVNIETADSAPTPSATEAKQEEAQTNAEPTVSADQEAAAQEKELGNAAYKKRDFTQAIAHYDRAFELEPTNASFLANKSAALFEMGNFEECIAVCERTIEVGRENRAEFKLIGRVLGRIGSCHEKMDNLELAIKFYDKSLAESRNPEIHNKLKAVEKLKLQREKDAYRNPELAEQERNLGNAAFKSQDFVTAVKHYTEAIKRDETDPRAYSNRAACYLKLAAIQEGLKDAEKCIELDPAFVKGYLRKAALQFAKREFEAAIATCELGMQQDQDGKHRPELQAQIGKCYAELSGVSTAKEEEGLSEEERLQRALRNPEVQEILGDPAMRLILKQMESDPKAAMEHLKNPTIAGKIRKLAQAGILRTQ